MRKGFTLIELLIVVAIIGILAAIAVPNFMNAQIRAKISRAVSDMRNLETALEMYRVDFNIYPPWTKPRAQPTGDNIHPNEIRFYRLTTPISYIATIPSDPFVNFQDQSGYQLWGTAYDYTETVDPDVTWHANAYGYMWRMNSWGPEGINRCAGSCNSGPGCPGGVPRFLYHPSNGLTSVGDIVRVGPPGGRYARDPCKIHNDHF